MRGLRKLRVNLYRRTPPITFFSHPPIYFPSCFLTPAVNTLASPREGKLVRTVYRAWLFCLGQKIWLDLFLTCAVFSCLSGRNKKKHERKENQEKRCWIKYCPHSVPGTSYSRSTECWVEIDSTVGKFLGSREVLFLAKARPSKSFLGEEGKKRKIGISPRLETFSLKTLSPRRHG